MSAGSRSLEARTSRFFARPIRTNCPGQVLDAFHAPFEGSDLEDAHLRSRFSEAGLAETEPAIDSVESDREGGAETGREDTSQRIGLQR